MIRRCFETDMRIYHESDSFILNKTNAQVDTSAKFRKVNEFTSGK
jgi:hypothetical protein